MNTLAHFRRTFVVVPAVALVAVLLALAPGASAAEAHVAKQAHAAQQLTINVLFDYQGGITVSLPDGTPVGTTTGSPTVIPAGYYSLVLTGPGACSLVPYFTLNGPGVAVTDNMAQGEEDFTEYVVDLQPNSSYQWKNGDNPNVVYKFSTNASVLGTQAPPAVWTGPYTTKSSNKDVVGSKILPARGALTGLVSSSGALTVNFKGKGAKTLQAGKYKLTVSDTSAKGGFYLKAANGKAESVTGAAFVGKRTATLDLTAGKWLVLTSASAKSGYTLVVR